MQTTTAAPTIKVESTKELERSLIKSMAGKYRVNFKFTETFAPAEDYVYGKRHFSQAKEVAIIIEDSEDRISIQHILFVSKDMFIKHWRQDWVYENREVFKLIKDHEWEKTQLSAAETKGTWTQKVFQVDDSPRYEGFGTWVHVDGRHFWESTADAALPRREISTAGRTDYNVLRRHSHIEIFEDGSWVLDQDNEKIHRSDDRIDTLICLEKGLETFKPEEYDCSVVSEWWHDVTNFWADVRRIWAEIMDSQDVIKLSDDEQLYEAQFALAKKFSGDQYDATVAEKAIRALLEQHVAGFKA